jgi:hypothetical protein
MIPIIPFNNRRRPHRACAAAAGVAVTALLRIAGALAAQTGPADSSAAGSSAPAVAAPVAAGAGVSAETSACLTSGDGYLRAHVAGAIEAAIDWPNSGTRCEGEPKSKPPGVRLSFQRVPGGAAGGAADLLFVFGLTGVREGRPAHEVGANLTIILQGTERIYGTLGDSRCTVDSLKQRRLPQSRSYRVEARGFCTQPAHAVRGEGAVLVSTFEFAGLVNYAPDVAGGAAAPQL